MNNKNREVAVINIYCNYLQQNGELILDILQETIYDANIRVFIRNTKKQYSFQHYFVAISASACHVITYHIHMTIANGKIPENDCFPIPVVYHNISRLNGIAQALSRVGKLTNTSSPYTNPYLISFL